MPPRIRSRACKALKENINVTENRLKPVKSTTKLPRRALADKTNSASDDTSVEITKPKKTITKSSKAAPIQNSENKQNKKVKRNILLKPAANTENVTQTENSVPVKETRPRRDRRIPTRFVENSVLNNLSNSRESVNVSQNSSMTEIKGNNTPLTTEIAPKNGKPEPSPFKTPSKPDSSLLACRPRRICRLPSRFEDHSISPNKYIPIQPANASTPIQKNKNKPLESLKDKVNVNVNDKDKDSTAKVGKKIDNNLVPKVMLTRLAKIDAKLVKSSDNSSNKSSPDSNNNAKGRSTRPKKNTQVKPKGNTKEARTKRVLSPTKRNLSPSKRNLSLSKRNLSPSKRNLSPTKRDLSTTKKAETSINVTKSPLKKSPNKTSNSKTNKNLSFKLLGSKKPSQKNDKSDLDVYEFTFDPNEEPQPQKKKRKRVVTKKPSQPKKVTYKSSYDQNISKALSALKNAVKPGKTVDVPKLYQIAETSREVAETEHQNLTNDKVQLPVNNQNNVALNDTGKNYSVHECNYPSIRVEDIAADIELSIDHHDDINYSPVTTPRPHGSTPNASVNFQPSPDRPVLNNDPLNLQEELSFFDDQPVASSSMNMSVRHPLASPWRVEFGSLPIKWPVNTYVKPNMTPAVESSFISAEDSIKKKHVYTNLFLPANDVPEPVNTTPNLKQTSIISFIKEMAEKSAKKKRGRSISPAKAVYVEVFDKNAAKNKNKKAKKTNNNKEAIPAENTSEEQSSNSIETSSEKENSKEGKRTRKRKNDGKVCDLPAKSPRNKNNKDCTYFGFDDSENPDLENVSPIKMNSNKGRNMRTHSRAVLQEINGPTRAKLPVAAKTKIATSSEAVNKVYEELKSAADAPVFPEKDININNNATNIEEPAFDEDSLSVHLFEDIEVVHHVKPTRKSYGKAKKVTFRQQSSSDSESNIGVPVNQNDSSDYDDLADLSFEIPDVKEKKTMKKKRPKKMMSKKEEKEAEAWAANFNSMCEDIEDFPLLVE